MYIKTKDKTFPNEMEKNFPNGKSNLPHGGGQQYTYLQGSGNGGATVAE